MNVDELESRDARRRTTAAVALVTVGVVGVAVARAAGGEGVTVGAALGALVLAALGIATWPTPWTPGERRHRRLDAIWRSQRADADDALPWPRYVAWAEADDADVVLALVVRGAGAPSRYEERVVRRLDPEDVETAAGAMEALRQEAAGREAEARDAWHAAAAEEDRRRHERALSEIDAAGCAELERREARMRAELAEQDRAERRAQALAVADALRRR